MPSGKSRRPPSRFATSVRKAYRSGLEVGIASVIAAAGIAVQFETLKVPYCQPMKQRTYTPDFLLENGIILETKGLFSLEDRQKHLWVKAQHPSLDIRFVFQNAHSPISKGSPTSYARWADKHAIPWAHKTVPIEWLTSPPCPLRLAAIEALKA